MREKNRQLLSEALLIVLMLGMICLLFLPPVAAIASVAWLFVTATTPDIFSLRIAVFIGTAIGAVVTGAALFAASKVSGDAFPDAIRGIILPSGAILLAAFVLQPVAARITRNRIAQKQAVVFRLAK